MTLTACLIPKFDFSHFGESVGINNYSEVSPSYPAYCYSISLDGIGRHINNTIIA